MDTKPWYLSKGVWGSIIVVAVILLRLLGRTAEAEVVENESEGITAWIGEVGALIGAALAFYGRIKASTTITT